MLLGTIGNANFLAGDFEAGRDNYRLPCTAPAQSEIRSFISGSDNVSSNLAIMIVPLMNWPARTWPRVIASS